MTRKLGIQPSRYDRMTKFLVQILHHEPRSPLEALQDIWEDIGILPALRRTTADHVVSNRNKGVSADQVMFP